MSASSSKKLRLDKCLFERGLVDSREKAKALILSGNVLVNGLMVDKAGASVRSDDALSIKDKMPYVSRGGLKLEQAVKEFSIDFKDKITMDVGASTGGFTDCMLQNGASKVYAVDVGYGQFDWRLRNDEHVVLFEKTNIRHLKKSSIPEPIEIVTIDVSFISLLKVLPNILNFLAPSAEIIALIKPQFEAGREEVGRGGVVKDENIRLAVIEKIKAGAIELGLDVIGVTTSPIKGPKGNVEYLIYLKKS